jgi:hypothetical protein
VRREGREAFEERVTTLGTRTLGASSTAGTRCTDVISPCGSRSARWATPSRSVWCPGRRETARSRSQIWSIVVDRTEGSSPGSGMSEAAHKCHRRDHSRPRIWGWACSRASASTRRVGEGAILGAGRLGPPRQMRRRGVVLARPRLLGRGSGLPRSSQTLGRPRLVLTSCSGGTASAVRTDGCAAGWAAGPVGWPRRRAGDWRSGCHTKRPRAADP